MSIRVKLLLIILFICIANFSYLAINYFINRPIVMVQKDHENISRLNSSLLSLSSEVNKLDSELFNNQYGDILLAWSEINSIFQEVESLKYLPDFNKKLSESFSDIIRTKKALSASMEEIGSTSLQIKKEGEYLFGKSTDFSMQDLISKNSKLSAEEKRPNIYINTNILYQNISTLDTGISISLERLELQNDLISTEIEKIKNRRAIISLVLIISTLGIAIALAVLTTFKMSKIIKRIELGIERMKDGDLADRIPVQSKDELGALSNNVNVFTDHLSEILVRIKESSRTNNEIKDDLINIMEIATRSTSNISNNAEAIKKQMDNLKGNIGHSSNAIDNVIEIIQVQKNNMTSQNNMVDESSSSVTEMIASINSVGDLTRKKTNAMKNLVKVASKGGDRLSDTTIKIQQINENVDEIKGTADLIQSIASQTNLLAMNAAIEAAHAGDSGKGFAVVADEIRKLAEASSTNSKHINGVLKNVILKIQEAVESGEITKSAFEEVNREVSSSTSSFEEVSNSMDELLEGGSIILQSMESLKQISIEVNLGSANLETSINTTKSAMEEVDIISKDVNTNVNGISTGLGHMNELMGSINTITDKITVVSQTLEQDIEIFITTEEPSDLLE